MESALAFVYIGQGVRDDHGILTLDCRELADDLGAALDRGLIRAERWCDFTTYKTTAEGDALAREHLGHRVERSRARVEKALARLPRLVQEFLVREVLTDHLAFHSERARVDEHLGQRLKPSCPRVQDDSGVRHYCLLEDPLIESWRRELLELLVQHGLAVKATLYMCNKKKPPLRARQYVLAPETERLLNELVGPGGQMALPSTLEHAHTLFHFLTDNMEFGGSYYLRTVQRGISYFYLPEKEVRAALEELTLLGLMESRDEPGHYSVTESLAYSRYVRARYLQPLAEYVRHL